MLAARGSGGIAVGLGLHPVVEKRKGVLALVGPLSMFEYVKRHSGSRVEWRDWTRALGKLRCWVEGSISSKRLCCPRKHECSARS